MIVQSDGSSYSGLMVYRSRLQGGFTLIEMLVVLAIIGILAALFFSFWPYRSSAREVARILQSEMTRVRGDAMANTLARRLVLLPNGDMRVESAIACGKPENAPATPATPAVTNWTIIRTLSRQSDQINATVTTSNTLKTPDIIVCYSPRGFADSARTIEVRDAKRSYLVELALAGGVRSNAN